MYRDLSQPIETGMPTFPGDPSVELAAAATIDADGYRVRKLHCGSHTGTHIDAPSHTEPDGGNIDSRPIEEFVLEARTVDATPVSPREPIPEGVVPDEPAADILLIHTGWDEHWGESAYFEHPYLTPGAAERLAAAGCGVGVDALNPDPTPTDGADPDEPMGVPVHGSLLGDELPIIENLTGLAGLPDRVRLYAFPLPLADCDGAPIRAVAEW